MNLEEQGQAEGQERVKGRRAEEGEKEKNKIWIRRLRKVIHYLLVITILILKGIVLLLTLLLLAVVAAVEIDLKHLS